MGSPLVADFIVNVPAETFVFRLAPGLQQVSGQFMDLPGIGRQCLGYAQPRPTGTGCDLLWATVPHTATLLDLSAWSIGPRKARVIVRLYVAELRPVLADAFARMAGAFPEMCADLAETPAAVRDSLGLRAFKLDASESPLRARLALTDGRPSPDHGLQESVESRPRPHARLEEQDGWEWRLERVAEYEGLMRQGLTKDQAAKRVKGADGAGIPRKTLDGWRERKDQLVGGG